MAMAIAKTKDDVKELGKFEIEVQLEDVVIDDNETAVFQCKISYDQKPSSTWYNNGIKIQPGGRISITESGHWRCLEIERATSNDQGLYEIECIQNKKSKYQRIVLRAHLYVAPSNLRDSAAYHTKKYNAQGVSKHLASVKLSPGNKIKLEATLAFESHSFIWFKNNEALSQDQRTLMLNSATTASLTIENAQNADTGVYFVVAQSEFGYVSSFTDVLVGVLDEPQEILPNIEQCLPDDIEAFHGEEVRLIVKAQIDMNTTITWSKDNIEIDSHDATKVTYNNNYIGLIIPTATMSSEGIYKLTLDNNCGRTAFTDTKLSINQLPMSPPEVNLIRPLESVVACCGSKVSFDCSFELADPTYFYVVWYIGHYRVERTNTLFNVVCSEGQFLLFINKFEPGMAGEVICELRRAWPNKKSAMVKRAFANLVMVPRPIIQALQPALESKLVYERSMSVEIRIGEKEDKQVEGAGSLNTGYLLKIVYCRLDEEGLCFLQATCGSDTKITRLTIHSQPRSVSRIDRVTAIEWEDCIFPTQCWYSIDLGQANGTFAKVGVTSRPVLEVNPPLYRMMTIIIRAIEPMDQAYDSEIRIVPPPEIIMHPPTLHEIQPISSFISRYTTTDKAIGAGTFGRVKLVQDNQDKAYYAAKFVKIKMKTWRDQYLTEFNIMKDLHHPKLIELIGFYESKKSFIYVMEFCWGGELFDRVVGEDYLKEADVVGYVKQLCQGLEYIHAKAIVHLDLKPENVVCLSPNSRQIKLIDFGLARKVSDNQPRSIYGTMDYIAPEVIEFAPTATANDMWSLGVVTYVLMSGILPFDGNDYFEYSSNVCRDHNYLDTAFKDVSDLAKDFVDHLLVRQPQARMTAAQALEHHWIRFGPPQEGNSEQMAKMRKNLKSYLQDYRSKWQRAGNVMKAVQRLRIGSSRDPM